MAAQKRPEEIKGIIFKVMGQLSDHRPEDSRDICAVVERVFSEKERKHVKVAGLKDQTLILNIDSPAWGFQFNLKRLKILKDIQKEIPGIQKIHWKIGKVT